MGLILMMQAAQTALRHQTNVGLI